MKTLTLTPAYGRDYTSKAACLADWEGGKDFQMQPQGCYCSSRDVASLKKDGYTHINFRYKNLMQVASITI